MSLFRRGEDQPRERTAEDRARARAEREARRRGHGGATAAPVDESPLFDQTDAPPAGNGSGSFAPIEDVPPAYDERAYDERAYDERAYDERAYDERAYDERAYDEPPPAYEKPPPVLEERFEDHFPPSPPPVHEEPFHVDSMPDTEGYRAPGVSDEPAPGPVIDEAPAVEEAPLEPEPPAPADRDPDVFQDTIASPAARPEPEYETGSEELPAIEPAVTRPVPPPLRPKAKGRLGRRAAPAGGEGAPPRPPRRGEATGGKDPKPPKPPKPNRPRGRTLAVRIVALLALFAAAFAIWFVISLFQPFKQSDGFGTVVVQIPRGADAGQIGDLLERRDVIASSFFFGLRARLGGDDLKGGQFRLKRDMTYSAALETLTSDKPQPVARTTAITVPEGRSRREEAKKIATTSLDGSYLAATKRSDILDPRDYGARGASARTLEGFLYPETYPVRPGAKVDTLVAKQLKEFKGKFDDVSMRRAKRAKLTPYEVLTIASMVERETPVRRERRIIAGVIYNRLREGIPLGIDATLRFATNNWTRPLKESDLQRNTPYNTRTRQGLPPTPIGSPGLASIKAAANPKNTDYLYFVVEPGGCHAFSKTFEEFERDRVRYQTARQAQSGRNPGNCK